MVAAHESILIVDDQAGIRALLSEALGMVGYQVHSVSGGVQALKYLDQTSPDLVLLDMNMPGMSGLETLRELRRSHPALPVLMITADVNDISVNRAMELQISGWISKPFELEDLYHQVQSAVN